MSKVTVVTDAKGEIVVIGHGHLSQETARKNAAPGDGIQGGVRAGPGQHLHELEVSEDVSRIANWAELHKKVRPHVKVRA